MRLKGEALALVAGQPSVVEALVEPVREALGGRIGLRILSNLPLGRRVRVRAEAAEADVGSAALCDGIARASRFAELDPYRTVTHNKGFMNGVDAAALALGQDVRAIEAGERRLMDATVGGAKKSLPAPVVAQ